jgi:nicotinamide N-methyltransferase
VAQVFLTFTHHRPWLMEKDLSFFTIAQLPPFNFLVDKIMTKEMWPMFPQDPGSVEIRQQVHLYTLRRNETNLQNK